MPTPGEDAAWRRVRSFLEHDVDAYDRLRDDPGADRTSRLSPYLKYGVLHPRQVLAKTAAKRSTGATTFETELAWRDFYADVLYQSPDSAWHDLNRVPGLTYDEPDDAIEAWKQGATGYPVVDAGMRQLLSEGWMHNRVRMITASFLTKDLHVWWPVGARHFLDHLVDGDLASNNHGWQWVAGTGTDAAPYFRVFNPTTQGRKFDPDGAPTSGAGCQSSPTPRWWPTRTTPARRTGARRGTPTRSWTTPSSAARRWPGGTPSVGPIGDFGRGRPSTADRSATSPTPRSTATTPPCSC
jgi:deoxyribodipyrimidine photolyase